MSKAKQILIIMLSVMISVRSLCFDVSAESAYKQENIDIKSYVVPDGYEKCSPTFARMKEYEKYDDSFHYACYNESSNSYDLVSYYDFNYNCITLILNDLADWNVAYETYFTELDFDVVTEDGRIELYDVADEGDSPFNTVTIERKSNEIKMVCKQMYNDGILENAVYNEAKFYYQNRSVQNEIYCTYNGTAEELSEIASKYSDNAIVKASGYQQNEYIIEFYDIQSLNRLNEVCNAFNLQECIPSIYYGSDLSLAVKFIPIGTIDLFTAIQEEISCDTDANGTVEITDATAILESYANTAAGVAAASEENPMDVNGDGTVGIDDATFVLTVYAELAAGLR